jgi:hypothetical protein
MDLKLHLRQQASFGLKAFGEGERRAEVIDQIKKLIAKIEAEDDPGERGDLWSYVVMAAFDGLFRAVCADHLQTRDRRNIGSLMIARDAARRIESTQNILEPREWRDWRNL